MMICIKIPVFENSLIMQQAGNYIECFFVSSVANLRTLSVAVSHFLNCFLVRVGILAKMFILQ